MKYGIITSKGSYITINNEGSIKTYGVTRLKNGATTFTSKDKAQGELDELLTARKVKGEELKDLKNDLRSALEESTSISTIYTGCKLMEIDENES